MDFCLRFGCANLRAMWEGLSPEVGWGWGWVQKAGLKGLGLEGRGGARRQVCLHVCQRGTVPASPAASHFATCCVVLTPAALPHLTPTAQERRLFRCVWIPGEDEWEPYRELDG